MKNNKNLSLLFLLVFLIAFPTMSIEARKNHQKKSRVHKNQKQRKSGNDKNSPGPDHIPGPAPAPAPYYGSYPTQSRIFDVLSFGAKGDGVSDDSKAFQAAWKAACKVEWATVEIPSEFKFLIKPITIQGPCMPHLVLQIDGTLLAPPKIGAWPKSSLFQWINFKWIHNFTIQGTGTINGQGSAWWGLSQVHYIQALRFYACYDVTVRNIRIINSPQCHLKFDSSGDDCVSIQTGCSNVHIHHIDCGPGHGISLGGLGKDESLACVSGVVVENITVQNALYGVRIKTWQGGLGSVKNVSFSNIQVSDVKIPIMIDQFYCDKKFCKNQTGAVAISGVKYDKIIGTYSVQPIHLACSDNVPCTGVDLINIQLEPSPGYQQALCWNSYGKSQAPLVPSSIDYCLRRGGGSVKKLTRTHANTCW
ncbi:hypothetical protein HHK36_024982 [Tetracentron sinense]|uniref:Polygalacturonase n=1 Tax=Tetracentron sinense TaxID=13715 RepID=A0A834YRS4_TETSI|nr:hypothetical protein HHK36_024982 [Tetracentron sinense]